MTTEEISRGIYLSGGIGHHQQTLDELLMIRNPTPYDKSRILALQNLDKIAQIMKCPKIRPEEIIDHEGGTDMDKYLLIDYEFHDMFVQVKCMSRGYKTFTLPVKDLSTLHRQIESGGHIPEWHVELRFKRNSDRLMDIARIKTRVLVDIFSRPGKWHIQSAGNFFVVYWEDISPNLYEKISFSGT